MYLLILFSLFTLMKVSVDFSNNVLFEDKNGVVALPNRSNFTILAIYTTTLLFNKFCWVLSDREEVIEQQDNMMDYYLENIHTSFDEDSDSDHFEQSRQELIHDTIQKRIHKKCSSFMLGDYKVNLVMYSCEGLDRHLFFTFHKC